MWDPVMIIAQIVTLQCLFYMTLGLWQAILVGESQELVLAAMHGGCTHSRT